MKSITLLKGNLTKEVIATEHGAIMTIAVNSRYKDRDGNIQEQADFIPVSAYRKQAENALAYLSKGDQVFVVGTIRSYTDPETGYSKLIVAADRIEYLKVKKWSERDPDVEDLPDDEYIPDFVKEAEAEAAKSKKKKRGS